MCLFKLPDYDVVAFENNSLSILKTNKYGSNKSVTDISPEGVTLINNTDSNKVYDLAAEDDYMWAATGGGIVRWNTVENNYIIFTIADGLPTNQITSSAITKDGIKWFGTDRGELVKFDGYKWVVFSEEDCGYYINDIAIDDYGHLWIASSDSVCEFDGSKWTNHSFDYEIQGNGITKIAIDISGNIWVGTYGGGVLEYDRDKWTTYNSDWNELGSSSVTDIAIDNAGNKWFATFQPKEFWETGGVSKFDGITWTTYTSDDGLASNSTNSIGIDENGYIWVGSDQGVSVFDHNTWTTYTTFNSGIADMGIDTIGFDSSGHSWFGFGYSGSGISEFDGLNWFTHTTDGAIGNEITSVAIDQNSSLDEIAFIDEDGYIWLIFEDGSDPRKISSLGDNRTPKWSPNGEKLYFIHMEDDINRLVEYNFGTGKERTYDTPNPISSSSIDVSPSGDQIALVQSHCVSIFDLTTETLSELDCLEIVENGPPIGFLDPVFSNSNNQLAVTFWGHEYNEIRLYPLNGGEPERIGCCSPEVFLSDDQFLIVSIGWYFSDFMSELVEAGVSGIYELDINTGTYTRLIVAEDSDDMLGSADITADGLKIVYQSGYQFGRNGLINILDLQTGETKVVTEGYDPAWRPNQSASPDIDLSDQEWIAFVGTDGYIWLVHPDGSGMTQITDEISGSPKWNQSGDKLAFVQFDEEGGFEGEVYYTNKSSLFMYDPNTGEKEFVISDMGGDYDWSPGSYQILYGKPAGEILGTFDADGNYTPAHWVEYDGLWKLDLLTKVTDSLISPQSETPLWYPDWSPVGENILFYENYTYPDDSTSRNLSLGNLNNTSNYFRTDLSNVDCDWAPDGNRVACSGDLSGMSVPPGPCPIIILDPSGKRIQELSPAEDSCDGYPKWSSDGEWIAASSVELYSNFRIPSLDLLKPDGSERRRLLDKGYPVGWSPDSTFLLVTDEFQELYAVEISTGKSKRIGKGSQAVWQPTQPKPPKITNLSVQPGREGGQFVLSWTVPSVDEQEQNSIVSFDIRFSDLPITEDTWEDAYQLVDEPEPNNPGTKQSWESLQTDFLLLKRWYFAIKITNGSGNHSELSNIPSLIDTGFRPKPDGYNFPNYYDANSDDFTKEDMREMFGDWNVCMVPPPFEAIPCILKLEAKKWLDEVNNMMGNGHCFGMASTSFQYFLDPGNIIRDLQENAICVYDLSITNARRNIAYYQVTTWAIPVRNTMNQESRQSTPINTLEQLLVSMSNGLADPAILIINRHDMSGSHAVTPIAIENSGDDLWKIWVYNNTQPDVNVSIEINSKDNTWKANADGYFGDKDTHTIYLVPLSLIFGPQRNPDLSPIPNPILGEVWFTGDGHLLISDSQGRKIGYVDNQFINEIEEAFAQPISGEIEINREPLYLLPLPEAYTIFLDGNNITQREGVSVSFFGPGYVASAEDLELRDTSRDELTILPDGEGIKYFANESREASLSFAIDQVGHGNQILINNVDIGAGESISLHLDKQSGQFIFSNQENSGGVYDVEITVVSGEGERTIVHDDIEISATDTHIFGVGNWVASDNIILMVDHGSDGQMEEEIALEEETVAHREVSIVEIFKYALPGMALILFGLLVLLIGSIGLYKILKR